MKLIEHRVNDWKPGNIHGAYAAEIDVHVCDDGILRAKHNPSGNEFEPVTVEDMLLHSDYEHFFVDIKQNLDLYYLQKIVDTFGDKLIGIFDVPFPSSYYAYKAGLPMFSRISEYEMPYKMLGNIWLDPLEAQNVFRYASLFNKAKYDTWENWAKTNFIIACPSLHGINVSKCIPVWQWAMKHEQIFGIVTKCVDECRKVIND